MLQSEKLKRMSKHKLRLRQIMVVAKDMVMSINGIYQKIKSEPSGFPTLRRAVSAYEIWWNQG